MPTPPETGFLNVYIFEDPELLGGMFLFMAVVIGFLGLRDGLRNRVIIAVAFAAIGAAIFGLGAAVTTSGEHAEEVTRGFVDDAVALNVAGAMSRVSDEALLNSGRVENPGVPVESIRAALGMLRSYNVASNRITNLEGYTLSDTEAEVRLTCSTTTGMGYSSPSRWVLRVQLEDDDVWRIDRITFIDVAGQTPNVRF